MFPFGSQDISLHQSFRDLIVLRDIFEYRAENLNKNRAKLKACFFKDSELKDINPIYESFKRVKTLYFTNYNGAFKKLNILKQTSIQQIEHIFFW